MRNGREIDNFGTIKYWKNGKRHREGGPSHIFQNGDLNWHQNDVLHREDGPAIMRRDYCEYWIEGELHREDGPAIEWYSDKYKGRNKWYFKGIRVSETRFLELKLVNLLE